jgi:RimJ/RimL family protein N-acetyltransferase
MLPTSTDAIFGTHNATEAATAAMRFGFLDSGMDRIISIRQLENVRSARVMEKLGLARQFDTVVPENHRRVAVHAITRSQYQARFRG